MRNPLRSLFERRGLNSHELLQFLSRGTQSVTGQSVNETTAMRVAAV